MKKIFIIGLLIMLFNSVSANAAAWAIIPEYDFPSQFSEGMAQCSLYTKFINRSGNVLYQYPENAPRFSGLDYLSVLIQDQAAVMIYRFMSKF